MFPFSPKPLGDPHYTNGEILCLYILLDSQFFAANDITQAVKFSASSLYEIPNTSQLMQLHKRNIFLPYIILVS